MTPPPIYTLFLKRHIFDFKKYYHHLFLCLSKYIFQILSKKEG